MDTTTPHRHDVLLVDDDPDLLQATKLLLETEGYAVQTASSGAAALGVLASGVRPCVMLLDVWMPDMDGWDVCHAMRTTPAWASIPVVMLSASAEVVRAHEQGVAGVLPKPIGAGELIATVRRHCRSTPLLDRARGPRLAWDAERETLLVRR